MRDEDERVRGRVGSSKGERWAKGAAGWRREKGRGARGWMTGSRRRKRRKRRRTGRVSVGKRVASASTLFHPPTTLPLLLLGPRGAKSRRAARGGQGVERGVASRRKKGTRGRPRGARRRERGCRTPIRSIAAYSPYTFTTSLEFHGLSLSFSLCLSRSLSFLSKFRTKKGMLVDRTNTFDAEILSGHCPNLISRLTSVYRARGTEIRDDLSPLRMPVINM